MLSPALVHTPDMMPLGPHQRSNQHDHLILDFQTLNPLFFISGLPHAFPDSNSIQTTISSCFNQDACIPNRLDFTCIVGMVLALKYALGILHNSQHRDK